MTRPRAPPTRDGRRQGRNPEGNAQTCRRATAAPLKELGDHPDGGPITVQDGRYGPYVKWAKINATLPKGTDPANVTVEEALALIEAKAAKSGKGKTATAKKTTTKKVATTKKATATKKAPAKKTAAKKTATTKTAAKTKASAKDAVADGDS